MDCTYCQAENPDTEHRCQRCGRWLNVTAAHGGPAVLPVLIPRSRPDPPPPRRGGDAQANLFPGAESPKVVPIRARPPEALTRNPVVPMRQNQVPRFKRCVVAGQGKLEFMPTAPLVPKVLKTNAEAVIYCDAKAASWRSRLTATLLDAGMIIAGLAIFTAVFYYFGGRIVLERQMAPFYAGVVAGIAIFYKSLWCLAGGGTPGMRWVNLQLLNFDGHRPDPRQRFFWYASSYLSLLAAGAGLLWSLWDEEHLTWHDHIAKAFPTQLLRPTPFHRG